MAIDTQTRIARLRLLVDRYRQRWLEEQGRAADDDCAQHGAQRLHQARCHAQRHGKAALVARSQQGHGDTRPSGTSWMAMPVASALARSPSLPA